MDLNCGLNFSNKRLWNSGNDNFSEIFIGETSRGDERSSAREDQEKYKAHIFFYLFLASAQKYSSAVETFNAILLGR